MSRRNRFSEPAYKFQVGCQPSTKSCARDKLTRLCEMELETELNDRVIRVYWALDKAWFTGKISGHDALKHEHKIVYTDEQSEDLNLLQLDDERPAWELAPFTSQYFGF